MEAIPLGESRGGTPADERARKARAAPQGAAVGDPRLPAFRLPFFFEEAKRKAKGEGEEWR
jgi:hypothetical protein